jgi:hypothetical protein
MSVPIVLFGQGLVDTVVEIFVVREYDMTTYVV